MAGDDDLDEILAEFEVLSLPPPSPKPSRSPDLKKNQPQLNQEPQSLAKKEEIKDNKEVETRTILVFGGARVGKTTLIRMLMNETNTVQFPNLFCSEREEPVVHSFFHKREKDIILLNFVEAPAFYDCHQVEQNRQLAWNVVLKCKEHEITHIDAIFLACYVEAGLNASEIDCLRQVAGFFGTNLTFSWLVTKAESYSTTKRERIRDQITSCWQFEDLRAPIFFTGALLEDVEPLSSERQLKNIQHFKKLILKFILEIPRNKRSSLYCIPLVEQKSREVEEEIATNLERLEGNSKGVDTFRRLEQSLELYSHFLHPKKRREYQQLCMEFRNRNLGLFVS